MNYDNPFLDGVLACLKKSDMKYDDQFLDEVLALLKDRGVAYDPENVAARWSLTLGTTISAEQVAHCLINLTLAHLSHTPRQDDRTRDLVTYAATVR